MPYNQKAVYIGIGSNIEPRENISRALKRLEEQITITGISTFYWTTPIKGTDQNDYLNGVVQGLTGHTPHFVKHDILRPIEDALGRKRTKDPYASRTIDLDVLLYADIVLEDDSLTLPDPDIYQRRFIAQAITELDERLILPDTGKKITDVKFETPPIALKPDIKFTQHLKSQWKKT